jgi:hypothetical protein
MRTRNQLEIEARHLEQRVRDFARQSAVGGEQTFSLTMAGALPLFIFPESTRRLNDVATGQGILSHRMLRYIDVERRTTGMEYRLMEEEFVSARDGEPVRHYDPLELIASDDPLDVLSVGYERLDEDRLAERIAPVLDRNDEDSFDEARQEDLTEIEKATAELQLSAAARMRTKADAVDLLEGRLEPGDFVARTVRRQECFQIREHIALGRAISESIEV